jgi:hypothetical protein
MREILLSWLAEQKAAYIATGKPMWAGEPDEWFKPYHVVCENGHVSTMTLKSEALGKTVCIACFGDLFMCPNITEQQLKQIIDERSAHE